MYTQSEHIHRYAVWTAARAVQRGFTTTQNIHSAINQTRLPNFLDEQIHDENDFKTFHIQTHNKLKEVFAKLGFDGESYSYGRSAKIIAIYLKTAVGIRFPIGDPLQALIHPPIDRILLQALAKEKRFLVYQALEPKTGLN